MNIPAVSCARNIRATAQGHVSMSHVGALYDTNAFFAIQMVAYYEHYTKCIRKKKNVNIISPRLVAPNYYRANAGTGKTTAGYDSPHLRTTAETYRRWYHASASRYSGSSKSR